MEPGNNTTHKPAKEPKYGPHRSDEYAQDREEHAFEHVCNTLDHVVECGLEHGRGLLAMPGECQKDCLEYLNEARNELDQAHERRNNAGYDHDHTSYYIGQSMYDSNHHRGNDSYKGEQDPTKQDPNNLRHHNYCWHGCLDRCNHTMPGRA